ncbi:MAG: alpha-L-fucosidase [Nostocoides sp.]
MTHPTPDTSWFEGLGLGIFLNWSPAATQGWEMSWQMTGGVTGQFPAREPVACETYFANSATFAGERFDPDAWAASIKAAGAKYAVLGTKHHDGFAMWDSALSDYSVTTAAPINRDVVAEVVSALRAHGIRVALYFSIIDWHSELYPRFTDDAISKPYVIGHYPRQPETWDAYRAYLLGQLTELLTRFGPVDIIWLDGEFEHTTEEWDFAGIREHIRSLSPSTLVNDRCVGFGDFRTPEQQLPENPPQGPWEQCMTMNDSWGWVDTDHAWKSPHQLIESLVETRIAGGNLLLSVGPMGDGAFPPEAEDRLAAIGVWMSANGEALEGIEPGLRTWQCRLPSARRVAADGSERLFIFLTMDPGRILRLRDLPVRRVERVSLLGNGTDLDHVTSANIVDIQQEKVDALGDVVISLPEDRGTLVPVVALDIASVQALTGVAGGPLA